MKISFKSKKLQKMFSENDKLQKKYGNIRAKKIRLRMSELRAAHSLVDFWPPKSGPSRCHELTGDRSGQLSVDLDHPYRLVFSPDHDPVPERDDGGLDWSQITSIKIIEVEDTHG